MLKLIVFFLIVTIFAPGCHKKNLTANMEDNLSIAQDNSDLESEFQNIYHFGENQMRSGKTSGNLFLPECASIKWDTIGTKKVFTIDFGSTPCLCYDGIYREGKLRVEYQGNFYQAGSYAIIQPENYKANFRLIQGIKRIDLTQVQGDAATYRVKVTNASITYDNGVAKWQSERTIIRSKGHSTPLNPFDDAYSVSGTAEGTNRKGIRFSVITESPLIKDYTKCGNLLAPQNRGRFISGKLRVKNEDSEDYFILDYDPIGGAPCDRLAAITWRNKTYNITIW
ncbi:MAG: hypothetical protein RML72_04245 [Bacteroidia bacterium]|nr:hypothetical protein [Bacteroidia bacterium]MDW8158074.1 hypothetical protein [Bacteroidia bacterium]